MIAPRSRTEPALPTTSRGRPSAEHDRRRHHARQPVPGLGRSAGDEVVLAEHVVQLDAGARNDHAGARAGRRRERRGVAVGVDGGDVRRAAGRRLLRRARRPSAMRASRLRERVVREQPLARARRVWSASANASSRTRVCSRITSTSAAIASALPRLARADALEQREPVGDQDPARGRRRVRDHLVAEVRRRAPAHARSPRTRPGRRPSGGRLPPRPCARPRAASSPRYSAAGALRGDPFERAGEVGKTEDVARLQPGAVRPAVEAAPLGGVAEDQVEDRVQVRLRPRQLDALAGELDRRRDDLGPRAAGRTRGAPLRARPWSPGTAHDAPPMRKTCVVSLSPPKPTSIACISAPFSSGRPRPGVATKKSATRAGRRPRGARARSRPRPGPVSGLSATQPAKPAATHASTALPPSSRMRAPARAVSAWPAAIAPFMKAA